MSPFEKFYEEELRYLYESGKEFAGTHPDRARFLNIDAVGDRDPYVERLFEGFAFLAARIREKLDDSFPEFTEGLIHLMYPRFRYEIPSLTIIEMQPRAGMLTETRVIERGTEILSSPVGPESAVCRFTTTQPVTLNPVSLLGVTKQTDSRGRATLTFTFGLDQGVRPETLNLFPLRLYIHAEMPTALLIREYLNRYVQSATLDVGNGQYRLEQPNPPVAGGAAAGLTQEASLFPGEDRSFWGFSLLQEYFTYKEKFLVVDLPFPAGTAVPPLDPVPDRFTCSVTLDRDFPPDTVVNQSNFRLYCTPAANLFHRTIDPVTVTGKETEYHLTADFSCPQSCFVHSITGVTGSDKATGTRHTYNPLHAFSTMGNPEGRTYAVTYRPGFTPHRFCILSVGGRQLTGGAVREESLSIEARCTNGNVPREEIPERGLHRPGPGFPDSVTAVNISRPSRPVQPPESGEYLWVLLSHLGASYTSLDSAEKLRVFLSQYDWQHTEGNTRRIEAIERLSVSPVDDVVRGAVVRGIEFRIGIDSSRFTGTGDLILFGDVLHCFFSRFVSINSFVRLIIDPLPSGKSLQWNAAGGVRWPL